MAFRLQRWEEGKWWKWWRKEEEEFRDFEEPHPKDRPLLFDASVWGIQPEGMMERSIPFFITHPLPPGRYRVCFGYVEDLLQRMPRKVCSEEFSIP